MALTGINFSMKYTLSCSGCIFKANSLGLRVSYCIVHRSLSWLMLTTVPDRNLVIAKRLHVSCAHNMLWASVITP